MGQSTDLGKIDLNLLYTFCKVVDADGVSAAAAQLGRTQPAVSARLRQLEGQLGVKVLERVGRRLRLTPVGRAIDAEARVVIAGLRRIADQARSAQAEPMGTLRVGALPTVSIHILAPHIAEFVRTHRAVGVQLVHGLTGAQLTDLEAGKLDVVVSVGPVPARKLEVTVLGDAVPKLVLSKEFTPLPPGRVSIQSLSTMDYIGFGRLGDPFFDAVWSFLEGHGLDQRIRLQVPHIRAIKALISRGGGVSVLPGYTIVEPDLVTRSVQGLDFTHPIWLAVRPSARKIALIDQFCQALAR